MRRVKKITILLLAMVFSISILVGCGTGKQEEKNKKQGTEALEPTDTGAEDTGSNQEAIDTDTTEQTKEQTNEVNNEKISEEVNEQDSKNASDEPQKIRDIPSVDLVKEIKIGWNLGNTMDATGGNDIGSEVSWGNPYTTKGLIDAIKASGFNTLRVPTTWEKHLGPAPDYTIDALWLNRVQEIVDYGIANNMFVILNMHHEEWHFPSYDNAEQAKEILTKVWKQIADRFENYNEYLIFEGLNEPRQKGTKDEWNGGNQEGWDVVNEFNAAFVETIRNSGGNNPMRHLMIPPYGANSGKRAWSNFMIPEDDKIIVSIHAYTPYNFALNKTGTAEWSSTNISDTNEIDNLMNSIYDYFVSKNIPVIIGEFGSMNKDGNIAARADWSEYYVSKAAEKGIPCIWWDNGAFEGSGELFGLIDRYSLTWKYPEIVDALMKGLE